MGKARNEQCFTNRHAKLLIFGTALLVRGFLGYVFYGSADVNSFIGITQLILNGAWLEHPVWCYFPVVCFPLWFCGFLSVWTGLPVAFCMKIPPILFDSLLAVLIFDLVRKMRPGLALRTGFMYAFSPVAIIISSIHGQWDAIVLFFLLLSFYFREYFQKTAGTSLLFGALFALSFLVKPYTLVFIFFFFPQTLNFNQLLNKRLRIFLSITAVVTVSLLTLLFLAFKFNRSLRIDAVLTLGMTYPWGLVIGLMALLWFSIGMYLLLQRSGAWDTTLKASLWDQVYALVGCLVTIIVCSLLFIAYGFNLGKVFDIVLRYGNQAMPIFGLPFAYPIQGSFVALLLKNRFWVLMPIVALALAYYKRRIDIFNVGLVVFAMMLGVSGLYCHYLMWLIPFLLITGHYKLAGWYNLVIGLLYVFYYTNPLANAKFPYEGMLSFVSLHAFSWFMPPAFLTSTAFVPLIRFLSNYAVPLLCLFIALYCFFTARKQMLRSPLYDEYETLSFRNVYLIAIVFLLMIMGITYALVRMDNLGVLFDQVRTYQMAWYHTIGENTYLTGLFDRSCVFNVAYLFLALIIGWSVLAFRPNKEKA